MRHLPVTWQEASIEESVETIIDYRGKTPSKTTSGIPLVTAKIINDGKIHTPTEFVSEETYVKWMKRGFPKKDDVLITTEAPLGEVAQLENEKVALAQRVILLRGQLGKLNNSYLKWVLQSSRIQQQLRSRSTGSTVIGIRQSELKKVKIPLPPLNEQKRIAAILDKADEIRRKRKEAIRLTDELLRSVFLDMFGDPSNSQYPIRSLKEVCLQITDGAHFTPTYTSSGVPFLRVTDIQNDQIDWNNVKYIPPEEHRTLIKRCHPKKGDILYSKNGTIGIPKIINWDKEFSIFVSLALLKPRKDIILSDYLESFLQTPFALRQALGHTKTGTVSNLHLVEIRKIKLPVPEIEIQRKWIAHKSKMKQINDRLFTGFKESNTLFNALMQRAFKGEL